MDCVARGELPYVVMGDFNMPIAESIKLVSLLNNTQTFHDVRQIATAQVRDAPTCHVAPSQGPCIDRIFVSASPIDNMFKYEVLRARVSKDHSVVSVSTKCTYPCST